MKKWTTKHGDLYLGDCLLVSRYLATNQEQQIDLVFGSPPYEDMRKYDDLNFDLKGQDWVDWVRQRFMSCLHICKGLTAFVIGHGKGGCRSWSAAPALLLADLARCHVCLRNPPLYKRNGVSGSGQNDWLRADYEWIVCATRDGKELPWHDTKAVGHPPKYKPGGKTSNRKQDGTRVDGRSIEVDISNPGNIIDCGAVGGGNMGSDLAHETDAPFPEELPDFFVRAFCPPNGIVFDPFCGSGTTMAAAIKTGRRFIGCDIRRSQIDLTLRRIEEAEQLKGLMI